MSGYRDYTMDLTEHPIIRDMEGTGYPGGREPDYPRCPVCGAQTCVVYEYKGYAAGDRGVLGCEECIRSRDAWEVEECFDAPV